MRRRSRFQQIEPSAERLVSEAKRLREEARLLPPGITREIALRRARHAETAAGFSTWLRSPGLEAPE